MPQLLIRLRLSVSAHYPVRAMLTPTEDFLTTETPLLIQQDLYFPLNLPGGGEVSEAQFQTFLEEIIAPL